MSRGRSFGVPLPFPFPLAIGVDICQISRVARILRGPRAERFVRRVLAPDEHRPSAVNIIATDERVRAFLRANPKFKYRPGRATEGTGLATLEKSLQEEEEYGRDETWHDGNNGSNGGAEEAAGEDKWRALADQVMQLEAKVRLLRGEAWLLGARVGSLVEMHEASVAAQEVAARGLGSNPQREEDERRDAHEELMRGEAADLLHRAATFLSGRFAAKEAVIKAHDLSVTFHNILIERPTTRIRHSQGNEFAKGAPIAVVRSPWGGVAQQHLVSISHDGDYSTAMCLAYRPDLEQRLAEEGAEGAEGVEWPAPGVTEEENPVDGEHESAATSEGLAVGIREDGVDRIDGVDGVKAQQDKDGRVVE